MKKMLFILALTFVVGCDKEDDNTPVARIADTVRIYHKVNAYPDEVNGYRPGTLTLGYGARAYCGQGEFPIEESRIRFVLDIPPAAFWNGSCWVTIDPLDGYIKPTDKSGYAEVGIIGRFDMVDYYFSWYGGPYQTFFVIRPGIHEVYDSARAFFRSQMDTRAPGQHMPTMENSQYGLGAYWRSYSEACHSNWNPDDPNPPQKRYGPKSYAEQQFFDAVLPVVAKITIHTKFWLLDDGTGVRDYNLVYPKEDPEILNELDDVVAYRRGYGVLTPEPKDFIGVSFPVKMQVGNLAKKILVHCEVSSEDGCRHLFRTDPIIAVSPRIWADGITSFAWRGRVAYIVPIAEGQKISFSLTGEEAILAINEWLTNDATFDFNSDGIVNMLDVVAAN